MLWTRDGLVAVDRWPEEEALMPETLRLLPNYPNPFNPSTAIGYTLPQPGHVSLVVYNLIGQRVRTLVNGFQPAGRYETVFDAAGLPGGLYFCRLEAEGQRRIIKMVLQK